MGKYTSWLASQAELVRQHGTISRLKALIKKVVRAIAQRVFSFKYSHPGLHKHCATLFKIAGLYEPLRRTYLRSSGHQAQSSALQVQPLTQHARDICIDLKAAISIHQTNNS